MSHRLAALVSLFLLVSPAFGKTVVPPYEKIVGPQGVPIYFFPSESVPIFELALAFEGGADPDPKGKSGLAALSAATARRGTVGMDEDAISRRLDDLAGNIDYDVDEERVLISARGLTEHAASIIDLLSQQLMVPSFPERPFERLRGHTIDAIGRMADYPAILANHALNQLVLNGTTKARPVTGSLADLKSITLEEARGYFRKLFRRDRLRVFVMGGKDRQEVLSKVAQLIERIPCPACGSAWSVARPWHSKRFEIPRGKLLLINRPGISEAQIRIGGLGPARRVAEFYDLRVADTIFGGQFGSRLNQAVREKQNLSYHISGGFDFGEELGTFKISTSAKTEKTGELLILLRKLIAEFARGAVTAEELGSAKDYLIGSFPLGLQDPFAIARSFFEGQLEGLPPDFIDAYTTRIAGVTTSSVSAALRRHFDPSRLLTVVVGDAAKVRPALRKAGISFVEMPASSFY